jgi:deazaflavin-dependent oxidoreductase (nitroreductase family)
MPEVVKDIHQPHGIARWAFRLPIGLFHIGLGWLFGQRFVLLTHTGRKSGLPRQTVLEIARYNATTGECLIVSGWGYKSDWMHNITANPQITFQVGNQKKDGIALRLTSEEAADELLEYSRNYPAAFKEITRFIGYKLDGTEDDIRAAGRMLPMFLLKPQKT